MNKMHILLDPNPPGGGGGGGGASTIPDWRPHIPAEFKESPSLATVKDLPDLIKGYVNAQGLIGQKRIALPPNNATEAQMAEFFTAIGRPDSVEKYSAADVKPADGVTFDEAGLKEARQLFYSIGLTDSQQKKLMDFYIGGMNKTHGEMATALANGKAATENALRQEWGHAYDANLGLVRDAIAHYGDADLAKELETSLGNNPGLTRMLLKFAKTLSEDTSPTNKFAIREGTPQAAQARIAELKKDAEFMKALDDRSNPGHADAVETWTAVHRQAGGSGTVN